jgi:CBS domain-containing membrane protein
MVPASNHNRFRIMTPSQTPPEAAAPTRARWHPTRLFAPILAGATLRERLVGCLGALLGIGITSLVCHFILGDSLHLAVIVAPIGASAVLLFAVPASPLAQPWPIIGGNTISAAVGVAVLHLVPDPALAAGIAVALAILVMSLARCLHPPGGAAALTAVLAGPTVAASGYLYPFLPVALNSVILVLLGIAFHRLSQRRYPHAATPAPLNTHQTVDAPAQMRVGFGAADIDAALHALDETFDIDRADLDRLFREVEHQALLRAPGNLTCAEIMSRDVISIGAGESVAAARALLLDHNIRTLPVLNDAGSLVGTVGLRELTRGDGKLGDLVSSAPVTAPQDLAMNLIPKLTDGRHHAVIVTDEAHRVLGLITQTDLLAALARALVARLDYAI